MDKEKVLIDDENNESLELSNSKKRYTILYIVLISALVIVITFASVAVNNHLNKSSNEILVRENVKFSEQSQQENNKVEYTSKSIDRFSNINVDESGERYFDIAYKDFLSNYNYFVTAEYGEISSNYTITGASAATVEGEYISNCGNEITRYFFPSIIKGQHVYADEFSNYLHDVIYIIDNETYNNMNTSEKNLIKKQIEFMSMALLPEMDEVLYENKIWSVLKKSIIDNEEEAIAVVGQVCFYTYNSEDNNRCIRIYPKKDLTYQQPQEKLPLEKAIIGKWQNTDGSIWEYKTNGTFTIDFSTYRPEDKSSEADILRKQDIIVIPYKIVGDDIIFKMGNVQYSNYVRIENGFKYEIESVGNTQATMKKVK